MTRRILPLLLILALPTAAMAQPGITPPGQTPPGSAPPPYHPASSYDAPDYEVEAAEPRTRTTRYGWQVFLADAATWTIAAVASDNDMEGLGKLAAAGVFFGGPLVHVAHGNYGRAGISLGLRAAGPMAGAMTGGILCGASGSDEGEFGCLGPVMLGMVGGYAAAVVVDWFVLAKDEEVIEEPTGWASAAPSLSLGKNGDFRAGVAFLF